MFFEYHQNNSGGFDEGEYKTVFIEASCAAEANRIAQGYGIYFDGCDWGIDCPCCGDRWTEVRRDDEGDIEPLLYGTPIAKATGYGLPALVVYANGREAVFK